MWCETKGTHKRKFLYFSPLKVLMMVARKKRCWFSLHSTSNWILFTLAKYQGLQSKTIIRSSVLPILQWLPTAIRIKIKLTTVSFRSYTILFYIFFLPSSFLPLKLLSSSSATMTFFLISLILAFSEPLHMLWNSHCAPPYSILTQNESCLFASTPFAMRLCCSSHHNRGHFPLLLIWTRLWVNRMQ